VTLACAAGAIGAACSAKTIPAGGLVLQLATDLRAGTDFDSFRLEISQQTEQGGWNSLLAADFRVPEEAKLPTTFAIAAGSSPDQVALIRFIARKGPQPVVLRAAEIQVPTDHVAELKMTLATSCYGQVRVDGQGSAQPMCADPSMSCQPDTGTCGPTLVVM
jgi:hypothetical protein